MNKRLITFALMAAAIVRASPNDNPFADLQREIEVRNQEHARDLAIKETQFVEAFNHLAKALQDFSEDYKASHTINAQKVKVIRKAYRKLEILDPWFDPKRSSNLKDSEP